MDFFVLILVFKNTALNSIYVIFISAPFPSFYSPPSPPPPFFIYLFIFAIYSGMVKLPEPACTGSN